MADTDERATIDPEQVLEEVQGFVEELEPEGRRGDGVRLDSSLTRDLGIDSLGRAELMQRLESRFGLSLPERVITDAESPRDLVRAVRSASPTQRHGGEDLEREEVAARGEETGRPEQAATLLEVLDWHVQRHGDRRHVLFLERGPGEGDEQELTYAGLAERARSVAASLQAAGLEPGAGVGVMLPSGLEYFAVFLGAQMAGGVPVPLYPPMRRSQIEDHLKRQAAILDNARVQILVTFDEVKPLARLVEAQVPSLERVVTADELEGDGSEIGAARVRGDDIAFLQYTSGSTGLPKGVVLTHENLLVNLRSMGEVLDLEDDVVVSWLPLYHDMGLIGAWMGSMYFGTPLVLLSPLSFLSRPVRWLRAIHRYGGTVSAAPNFAYELCLKKLEDEDVEGLDLSSWRIALNGAEPVSPRTVERFPERFGELGLRREAMMPVYGLAECSLAVTFSRPDEQPRIDRVDRRTFQGERRAEPAGEDAANPLRFVSCGRPVPGHEVRIVDDDGREVGDREEGRLQFRGPSATSGYFRNPDETGRLVRRDGWLDSEDLAYTADGEIYLTGRSKDVIVRAGRNIHPQEVEDAVGDLEGVRRGCVAVFAVQSEDEGSESLVVLAETRLGEEDEAARRELRERIESLTLDLTGAGPDRVELVPPRTVPKTSSGKLRRSAAREMLERGTLGAPGRAVWLQVVRLALSGVRPTLRRLRRRITGLAYATWFWGLFGLFAVPTWLAVCLLPSRPPRRRFVRAAARLLARLVGTSVEVEGLEHLRGEEPRVVTSNHASYLDGFVLASVLPPRSAYVVKGELQRSLVARVFLSRLGCVFVERLDPSRGEEGSRRAAAALERGDQLILFPEGTLQRAPGLQRFRMGAFVIAARTRTPVVPVVLRGTRSKLRGGGWFPRPGDVHVKVLPAVEPEGEEWDDALELKKKVREAMLEHLPEPDLAR